MVRMAGLIVRKDIDLVRERTDLKAVVEEYVTLRSAGVLQIRALADEVDVLAHDQPSHAHHPRSSGGRDRAGVQEP